MVKSRNLHVVSIAYIIIFFTPYDLCSNYTLLDRFLNLQCLRLPYMSASTAQRSKAVFKIIRLRYCHLLLPVLISRADENHQSG